jgi:hypothetical protein
LFSDTFAGIAPGSAPPFILAQVVGASIGIGVVRIVTVRPAEPAIAPA